MSKLRKFFLFFFLSSPVYADVATFQQGANGYSGALDLTIRNGSGNLENSGELNMKSALPDNGTFTRAALMSWDLSSLSAANTVTAVQIDLVSTAAGNNTATVHLYKLLQTGWSATQATWTNYTTGNTWNTAGARGNGADIDGDWTDGNPGSLSNFTVGAADVAGTVKTWATSSSFVSVVQAALGGTLHLYGEETFEANGNCSMSDSSVATVGNRPKLTITYTAAGGGGAPLRTIIFPRTIFYR